MDNSVLPYRDIIAYIEVAQFARGFVVKNNLRLGVVFSQGVFIFVEIQGDTQSFYFLFCRAVGNISKRQYGDPTLYSAPSSAFENPLAVGFSLFGVPALKRGLAHGVVPDVHRDVVPYPKEKRGQVHVVNLQKLGLRHCLFIYIERRVVGYICVVLYGLQQRLDEPFGPVLVDEPFDQGRHPREHGVVVCFDFFIKPSYII